MAVGGRPGEPAVDVDLGPQIADIIAGEEGVAGEVERHLGGIGGGDPLHPPHGLFEEAAVELVADGGDVAALLGAEEVAGAADLEVAHCQREPRPHAREFLDRSQAPRGGGGEPGRFVDEHVAVGAVVGAADTAAELVEIGQAVMIGLVDEDCVGVGDVEPTLDDRRRQEDLRPPLDEVDHHVLELGLREPAVADADRGVGDELLNPVKHEVDVVDPVVDEEHLAAAGQLAVNGVADHRRIPPRHPGFHGQPV